MKILRSRPGVTLVELMLFLALMGVASTALIGFFVLTEDSRVRQRTRADIEQVAVQLTQQLQHEVHAAERVLLPAAGATGSVLVLQAGAPEQSPLILAEESGALLLIRGANTYILTSGDITVRDFSVQNISPSDDRPGVTLTFALEKILPLLTSELLHVPIELGLSPLPLDSTTGDACGCGLPQCVAGALQWETCIGGACDLIASDAIHCP